MVLWNTITACNTEADIEATIIFLSEFNMILIIKDNNKNF